MKQGLTALLFAGVALHSACAAAENYPRFAAFFSATERSGLPESVAYEYYLSCEAAGCNLQRTTYDTCSLDSELKTSVMQVWTHSYGTEDRSLGVEVSSARDAWKLIAVKFGSAKPSPDNGETVIKLEVKPDEIPPMAEIRNMAGTVERVALTNGKRTIVSLNPVSRPGQTVRRSCPVFLKSFLGK